MYVCMYMCCTCAVGLATKTSAGLENELRIAKEQLSRAHADYK